MKQPPAHRRGPSPHGGGSSSSSASSKHNSTHLHPPPSYDDLLPASHRTSTDDVIVPSITPEFLHAELSVPRINAVHRYLWMVGRPMPPRALHYQRALKREFMIHERVELHLTWEERHMFLKPIPRYLFNEGFWEDHLRCEQSPPCRERGTHNHKAGEKTWSWSGPVAPPMSISPGKPTDDEEEAEESVCERCALHACALGFMLSYVSLIAYENDLRLAKEASLVPHDLTWSDWRSHVSHLLAESKRRAVNKRYMYGELRMGRLNKIYRFTGRAPIRGFYSSYNTYESFWHENQLRIATVLAYLVVVLTAMQVGLGTDLLQGSEAFQRASWGFTVFSIIAPLVALGLVLLVFFVIFLVNLIATLQFRKKRFSAMEKKSAANKA